MSASSIAPVWRSSRTTARATCQAAQGGPLVADGGLPIRLAYQEGRSTGVLAGYFAARAIPGVAHVSGDVYRRTIMVDGDPGVRELFPGGADHILLVVHLPRWDELTNLVVRARRIASLDLDLDEATGHLSRDPTIGSVARQTGSAATGAGSSSSLGRSPSSG